ncbi:MAG: hypothetical protein JST81_09710 [Bacteroidetes bacterium]|nr:hypothetical protein [Bacteroidota bacterium]
MESVKNRALLLIAGLIIALIYLTYFVVPPEANGEEYLYWGRMHVILSSIPAIIYFNSDTRKHVFPFICLVSFFQLIAFGLPVYFMRINSYQMNEILNLESMRVAWYGLLLFYATYFFVYNYVFKNLRPFHSIPDKLSPMYYNAMISVMLLIYLLSVVFELTAIQQLANFALYVFVGFGIYRLLQRRSSFWETSVLMLVIGFETVRRVTSGLIAELAVFVLFLCILIMLEGSKRYIVALLVIPFAIFYTQFSAVKGSYRQTTWFTNTNMSYEEKVELIANLIENEEKKAIKYEDKQGKDNFLWRFSYPAAGFSLVYSKTPSEVPYWYGSSYFPLFTKFIPRVLWPSKPEENMGQRFGRAYKVIRDVDTGTSINTPILAEIYMNFGLLGFYIGMFLLGILFIFLDKFFNSTAVSYPNQIVNMSIIFPLMIMESNFSLIYGNVFLICLSMYFIFRFIK